MPVREIVDAWMETHNVRTLRFSFADDPITFHAGQFLVIADRFKGYAKPVRRAYSIASSPLQRDYVDITVKREVPGLMSMHLTEVPVGYAMDVTGPSGKYLYEPSRGSRLLLLGAGSGVTPLHSIARFALESRLPGAEVHLFYSVKTPRDVIFAATWEALTRQYANFHFHLTMTRAEEGAWTGHRGRIDADWVRRTVPDVADTVAYICGPGPMVATSEALCHELGIPPERINTEKW